MISLSKVYFPSELLWKWKKIRSFCFLLKNYFLIKLEIILNFGCFRIINYLIRKKSLEWAEKKMLFYSKVLFLMLVLCGKGDRRLLGLPVKQNFWCYTFNYIHWDLHIFKSACLSLQPLIKTWAISSRRVLEILWADVTLSCPSLQMVLLTEMFGQCRPFFFFFFLPSAPFFLVKWKSLSRAQVCTNTRAGWWPVCQVPALCDSSLFSQGGGFCTKQGAQGL